MSFLHRHPSAPLTPDHAEHEFVEAILVRATPWQCFTSLIQFENYQQWFSPVLSATVLEVDGERYPSLVGLELDMRIRKIRYQLAYEYESPERVRWHLAGGDLKAVKGMYLFEEVGLGTRATCFQSVDLGFRVPTVLRRFFEARALRTAVTEFRDAVEAMAQS